MKKILITLVVLFAGLTLGWFGKSIFEQKVSLKNPISIIKPRTLDKYAFKNLAEAEIKPGELKIERILKEETDFTSSLFSLSFSPDLTGKEMKKTTGLLNLPNAKGPFPLIVMLRGYVDQKQYQTGDGTKKAGEHFAKNGFITIAPDFLGYGSSDSEADDIFESRFQTYTTVLTLLKSIYDPNFAKATLGKWDKTNIFLWGHSNGGQIALTILEITGKDYPTVLWAPVSKPFPYSILYYTDESDDGGKLIRKELAKFEEQYNPDLYSITKHFDRITAPIQLHQGTADDAVAKNWSDALIKTLKSQGLTPNYFTYPGSDHNLQPAWNTVVARDLLFFQKQTNLY